MTAGAFPFEANPNPVDPAERAARLTDPGFGRVFTDHMVTIRYSDAEGWHDAKVGPRGPLTLDPATAVLHYAQEIFEGLKAYRLADGGMALFRPEQNARRFQRSAKRLAMPELPEDMFLQACKQLIAVDKDWFPPVDGGSIYLRPFMIATEAFLGVRPARQYKFIVIASPAGSYFKGGPKPVSIWISDYTRAAPGGTGAAKCGGNYAASLVAQSEAIKQGCDQVVWLDAAEHRWIEEMGGMNLYFVYGSGDQARLMTPSLTGALLPGVTRDSLLTVAQDLGIKAEEGRISVEEWKAGCASGEITEVFACGTAAVVTPVGEVKSRMGNWTVGNGGAGEVTMRLRQALLDIQTGAVPDKHAWMHKIIDA